MLTLLTNIVSILIGDTALTTIVPAANILAGPVDITTETQTGLLLPQINVHIISESQRTVPLNTRDTMVQIDIWSRNSMLEVINIYERILTLLSYQSSNQNADHIFWEKISGANDQYESDRRIFHRSITLQCWVIQGN
jgi:hypothetical protein